MLRLDKLCVIVLIFNLATLLPSANIIKFVDELCSFLMFFIAFADAVFNNNYRRYKGAFIVIVILLGYVLYSMFIVKYNTTKAIITDFIIQIKPFIPFFVVFALRPKLSHLDCKIIKAVCVINAVCVFMLSLTGVETIESIVFHVAYLGVTAFISAIFYYYCCVVEEGTLSRNNMIKVLLILAPGLLCTRSKFYVEFVLILFFLLIYKPGMTRSLKLKHVVAVALILIAVVAVSWSKFSYYFLFGNEGEFDPDQLQSYARPVLYLTGGLILWDHFPFGTGLASFASYASADSYSNVYYEYGINRVYGLQPEFNDFICDAYFPSLAQFGIVGIVLFIVFWRRIYKMVRQYLRIDSQKYKHQFIVGAMMVCFIMVESTTGTIFVQSPGLTVMMGLGLVCSQANSLTEANGPEACTVKAKQLRMKRLRFS